MDRYKNLSVINHEVTLLVFFLGEYFPKVSNDTVHVWEDESIAFDALENDYFAGGNASIVEFSNVIASPGLHEWFLYTFYPKHMFSCMQYIYTTMPE